MRTVPGVASAACFFLVLATCATTPDDIHAWGYAGDYDRIRQELRKNPREDVRVAAAIELGKGNHVWAIPDLVTLSGDSSPKVRQAAVEALGHYAGAEVYHAIIQRTGDSNQEVARTAERILRTWGSETVDFLLEALTDRNYRVRASAVQVLGRMQDSRIGPALTERARLDENSLVRRQAAKGLGNMGYAPAKEVLFKLKNTDPASEVALEAERALSKIGGKVSDVKLVVLPFRADDRRDAGIAARAADSLRERLMEARVCEVLQAAPGIVLKGDLSRAATEVGKRSGADQVVFGAVERKANKITMTVYRIEIGTGKLQQQESDVGYDSAIDKLIDDLTRSFVARFE